MLKNIIDEVKQHLTDAGLKNVYSAFDAVPTERKGSCFTVVGVKSFSADTPLYAPFVVYFPFRAEVEVTMLAPGNWSMERLYEVFCEKAEPALLEMSGMKTRLASLSLKPDSNLSRMTLRAVMDVSGTRRMERSGT